jgi:hypothetical protein
MAIQKNAFWGDYEVVLDAKSLGLDLDGVRFLKYICIQTN